MNKFFTPVILVIVSIGLFVFYINPTYADIQKLKDENNQYKEAQNKSKELRTIRDSLLAKYNSFSTSDLENIKKLLPDTVDNVRLVMNIDDIASKHGITITSINVQNISEGEINPVIIGKSKDYDFVALEFSMFSNYDNFINFISDLKDSLRLVDVTHIDFDVPEIGSDVYKYNIGIKTYWLK